VKSSKPDTAIPIGRAARIAFEIDAVRAGCSKAAQQLVAKNPLDENELEECARLDDALARAHRIIKAAVRNIMLTRIKRRSRRSRAK
jgi:hypothetical protein